MTVPNLLIAAICGLVAALLWGYEWARGGRRGHLVLAILCALGSASAFLALVVQS